ncbi:MAG: thiamine/thiamine pyrophosphate ABC transporter permease ThiP [Pseudomonadota bacterium]
MAGRHEPLSVHPFTPDMPARLVLVALAVLCLTPLIALGVMGGEALRIGSLSALLGDPFIQRALRFTLVQAALSTLISVALAVPVVLALRHIQQPWLLRHVWTLFALPLVLPQIVAALAIAAVFGHNGWIADLVAIAGINWPSIYGLAGILLAHVFFNLPLAARVFDLALQSQPVEYEKNAAQLGLTGWRRFILIEGAVIRDAAMGVSILIFLLCSTSFTIVLMLGGGPRSTTLEVAIYQALAFDFDLGRAVMLVALQVLVTGGIVLALMGRRDADVGTTGFSLTGAMHMRAVMAGERSGAAIAMLLVLVAVLFVALPFIFIVFDGFAANPFAVWQRQAVVAALLTSIIIGLFSSILAVFGAVLLTHRRAGGRFLAAMPVLALVFPPIVLSAGWFLTLRQFTDPFEYAAILVVVINAAMALPFVLRIVGQALQTHAARYGQLEDQLALTGWARWRISVLPALRAPLLVGFAFAFALSLGDFGVIALFGSERLQTLPYMIYASFGSYRTNDAAALALLLAVLVFIAIGFAEWLGQRQTRSGAP